MVEKILFEYIISRSYSALTSEWDRITVTNREIYIYRTNTGRIWRKSMKAALEGYFNTKIKGQVLEDLSKIYNGNLEIISGYEGLKNKFLEYLNS